MSNGVHLESISSSDNVSPTITEVMATTGSSRELNNSKMLTPESIIFIGQSSTAATSLPTTTTTSNTTNNLTSSSSLPLMTSTIPTTLKPMMPSSNHMVGSTIIPITNSSVEPRLRWVDFHHRHQQHQAYPPRVPSIPGIPSGFRNTIATIVSTTTTTTTMSPNDASTIGPMYSAGAHHPFFSGTNLNPIGFGGAVIMDDVEQPFKTPNPNRRYNITRVERKCFAQFINASLSTISSGI